MAISPLERLLRSSTGKVTNPYDDGTLWSQKPTQPSNSLFGDMATFQGVKTSPFDNYQEQSIEDPLEYPRGQIDYYTGKINDAGLALPEPSMKQKALQIGGTALGKTFDVLGVTGAPINAVAGAVNELIDTIGNKDKQEGLIKDAIDVIGKGLESGFATIAAPLNSKLREKRVDISDVFNTARESENDVVSAMSGMVEVVNPIYGIARVFGAEHDTARKVSGTITSTVADIVLSMKLDIGGIGKALKVVNRGDEIAKIAKVTQGDEVLDTAGKVIAKMNMDDIDKVAKKITNSIDGTGTNYDAAVELLKKGYTGEAASILRRANKKLGGIGDYKGLTMGNKTLLSVEQLQKIGSTKTGKVLANIVGGYASPIGLGWSWMSGRTAKGLANENLAYKLFGGGNTQEALKSAYKAMEDGRAEDVISAIYGAKKINKIHNVKNFADSLTHKNAETLNSMLKNSKLDTNAIMDAIELHGSKEIVDEIIKTPKINPNYLKAAAKNRDQELRHLQHKITQDGKKLQDMKPEELKKYIAELRDTIKADEYEKYLNDLKSFVEENNINPEEVNDDVIARFLKENKGTLDEVKDDEATSKFYADIEKIMNMPADTPQQRAGITRRLRNLLKKESEETVKYAQLDVDLTKNVEINPAMSKNTLDDWANNTAEYGFKDKVDLSYLENVTEEDNLYTKNTLQSLKNSDEVVDDKLFISNSASLGDRKEIKPTPPEFKQWEDISPEDTSKLDTVVDYYDSANGALPQPKQGQSMEDYYKEINEFKRVDGRNFKRITEEQLSEVMDELNSLDIDISPAQYERIASLSAYEGDDAEKLVNDISKLKKTIREKQDYRRLSRLLADRSADGSGLTTSINAISSDAGYTKKFFLSTKNKDFNRHNYSYALLDKGLAMRKMIEEGNENITKYLDDDYIAEFLGDEYVGLIDLPKGTRLNKYSDQELTKIYESYLDAYEGRMPKSKFNWLKKHDEEVIDSWKYLSDNEIGDIKRHYTMFKLPPDNFKNLDNPVLDAENLSTKQVLNPTTKEGFEKNKNVVEKWSAEYEAEKKAVMDGDFLPSEETQRYANRNAARQSDLDEAMQRKRDSWLAGTQESDQMLEYMGINKDEYWEKPYEVLNAKKLDVKVYDAELGEYTTTSRERYIEKAKEVYHDITEARLKGKAPKLSEQQEKMYKHAEMAYEVEKTRARLGQTNKAFVAKADEILKKMWGDNKIPVGTEFYDTLRVYKTIDWTNSTLSKILIGDSAMQEIFDKGGQEAVYKKIAEELGIDFKDFFQFKNKKTGAVGFSDKDSFTAFLYERLNPYIAKKAKEGNLEYRKLWGIKDYSERFSLNKANSSFKGKAKANLNKEQRASALADIFGLEADELMDGDLLDDFDPAELKLEGFENMEEQLEQLENRTYSPKQFRNDKKKLAKVPADVRNSEIAEPTELLNMKQVGKKQKGVPANIVDGNAGTSSNPLERLSFKSYDDIAEQSPLKPKAETPLDKVLYQEKKYHELGEPKTYEEVAGKKADVVVPDSVEKELDSLVDNKARTKLINQMNPEEIQKLHEGRVNMDTKKVAEAMKTADENYIIDAFTKKNDLQKKIDRMTELQEKALQSGDSKEFDRLTYAIAKREDELKATQKQLDDLLSVDNSMPIREIRLEQIKATERMLDELEGNYQQGIKDLTKLIEDTRGTEDLIRWNLDRGYNGDMNQFKYAAEMIQKMEYRDTISLLSDDEKEVADFLSSLYKDIAVNEGLVDQDDIRQYFGYLPHMLNAELKEDPKMAALAKKIGFDIKDPFSVNHMSRKMQGTILELNRVMKTKYGIDDFFETNVLRQYVDRSLKSNSYTAKKELESMIRNGFETPIKIGKDFQSLNLKDMKRELDRLGIDSSEPEFDKGFGLKYESVPKGNDVLSGGDSAVESKFVDPEVTRNLREQIDSAKKKLKTTTNEAEKMSLEMSIIDLEEELETKIGTTITSASKETGKDITVPFSDRSKVHATDAMIAEAYTERYYQFIRDVKAGKHERYAFARVDEELEKNTYKVIKDGVMNDTLENQPDAIHQEALDLMEKYDNADDFLADMIAQGISPMENKPVYHLYADEVGEMTIEQMVEKGYRIIDRDMLNQYNKVMDRMSRNRVSSLNKWYNKAMSIFKAWAVASPGFHLNNVIGNTFNTVIQTGMDVFDPKVQKGAYDLLQDLKKVNYDYTKLTGDIYGVSRADLAREMVENGVMAGFFNTDVKAVKDVVKGTTEQIKEKSAIRKLAEKIDPFNTETNVLLSKNKDLGEFLERQGKISNVLAHLKQGRDMYTAIDLAQEALFDYADLTDFETNIVKQYIAPFYTFAKKNFSYQAENMANNPAVYTAIERLYRYADKNFTSEKERMNRPDYISGGLKVANGKYISVDTPIHTFASVLDPSNAIGMVNPMAKAAVDMIYNKKSYSGQKVSRDGNPMDYLQYGVETTLPFIRTADTILGLFSDNKADKERAMRWMAGNRLKIYDETNAERSSIYQYMDELQNYWYNSIEDKPELKDIAAQVAEARKQAGKTNTKNKNPLSALLGK